MSVASPAPEPPEWMFDDDEPEQSHPWPELDRFGSTAALPFPVDVLAPWQRDWVMAEAEFAQVPADLPAVLCLAATALATSRGIDVEVRDGWVEPTNLWVVCGAKPGERKSPVFDAATKPVFAYQEMKEKECAPKVAEHESIKRVLNAQIARAEKQASEGKTYESGNARDAIRRMQLELQEMKTISAPSLLADDATAEAVANVLETSGERMGIFSSEGGIFEIMAGRYSENGANLEIWLKSHSGDSHIVHRVKRPTIYLKRPLLTMALTTQPAVINGLAAKEGFRGKGLLARFLYCLPTSLMGARLSNSPRVPEGTRKAYGAAMIAMLVSIPDRPRRVALSEGADRARTAFQDAVEPRLGPDGDLEPIADWGGKLVGFVARVAGILHASDHAHQLHLPPSDGGGDFDGGMPKEIPLATWLRAQAVGEYALSHAQRAFDLMGADETSTLAKAVWAWVERHRPAGFTEREAYRATHATPETIGPALEQLVQRGYVRLVPEGPRVPGRPYGPTYEIRAEALPE